MADGERIDGLWIRQIIDTRTRVPIIHLSIVAHPELPRVLLHRPQAEVEAVHGLLEVGDLDGIVCVLYVCKGRIRLDLIWMVIATTYTHTRRGGVNLIQFGSMHVHCACSQAHRSISNQSKRLADLRPRRLLGPSAMRPKLDGKALGLLVVAQPLRGRERHGCWLAGLLAACRAGS